MDKTLVDLHLEIEPDRIKLLNPAILPGSQDPEANENSRVNCAQEVHKMGQAHRSGHPARLRPSPHGVVCSAA